MADLIQCLHNSFASRCRVSKTTLLSTLRLWRSTAAAVIAIALLSIAPHICQAATITYYANRAAFNAAKPGLPVERFSAATFTGNCFPGSPYCAGFQASPLNRSTHYAFFSANTILPGITITTLLPESQGNQNLIVLNNGAAKTGGTKSVGTNYFGDTLVVKFSPGVLAVAADIFACCQDTSPPVLTDAGSFTVTFYNGATQLGSRTFSEVAGAFAFFGVSSTVPITSVRILYDSDEAVTGIDNVAFGSAPAPNVVLNPSFENTTSTWVNTSCNYMALAAGSTKIPNWTVSSTTKNDITWGKTLTCDGHTAAVGTFFLDLTGLGSVSPNGTVQQTLSNLTISHQYSLSLDAISDHSPPLVTINGTAVALTASGTVTRGSDIWKIYTGSFVAPSTNPVLKIQNQGINIGFVDNVSIKAQ
jgi:hypothetical protein